MHDCRRRRRLLLLLMLLLLLKGGERAAGRGRRGRARRKGYIPQGRGGGQFDVPIRRRELLLLLLLLLRRRIAVGHPAQQRFGRVGRVEQAQGSQLFTVRRRGGIGVHGTAAIRLRTWAPVAAATAAEGILVSR